MPNNKKMADIQGQLLEYRCNGSGRPPIVLINGAGGPMEGWYKIYPKLESISTVFAYNRPGIGGSGKPVCPQTGDRVIATLRALLNVSGLQPPYLLVGHSIGGLYVNLFCRWFPEEVAGVVWLDATSPEDVLEISSARGAGQVFLENVLDFLFKRHENDEIMHIHKTVEQIHSSAAFPNIPHITISGGKPFWLMSEKVRAIRARNQQSLAGLSPQGKQLIAARSGHLPQLSEPDLVVDAIRDVLILT